jgi:hypothetical protein
MISKPMVRSMQTLHLSCIKIRTISKELNQASTWASSPRSTIGCIQNDFWAYDMFSTNYAPILHVTNSISKWTKMRFHMTHVTLEFHRVRPKRLLRLWYVRHKPCTYLASRLALSLNGLNRASTWALSPSGASKMIAEPVVHSVQTIQLSCIKISTISKWTESSIHLSLVTKEYHQVCPKLFSEAVVRSAQNLAPTLRQD